MDKTVTIDMREQINNAIDEFEKYDTVDSYTVTPAANYLSTVNPNAEELDQKHSEVFHTMTKNWDIL